MTGDLAAIIAFNEARLAEDKQIALAASGGTVTGEPGNWQPAPGGDEWEVHADLVEGDFGPDGDLELLVALRPGLARPPEESAGYWGAVISWRSEGHLHEWVPEPQFRHIARHDPARALRDVEAGERILERHRYCEPYGGGPCDHAGIVDGPCPDMRDLAARWRDHPDHGKGWKQ